MHRKHRFPVARGGRRPGGGDGPEAEPVVGWADYGGEAACAVEVVGLLSYALDDVAGISEDGAGAWAFGVRDDSGEVVVD